MVQPPEETRRLEGLAAVRWHNSRVVPQAAFEKVRT